LGGKPLIETEVTEPGVPLSNRMSRSFVVRPKIVSAWAIVGANASVEIRVRRSDFMTEFRYTNTMWGKNVYVSDALY
jgi:hypothetical protein